MSHYLFHFTRRSADKSRPLGAQAAELVQIKLWGIGENTPNRKVLAPGDEVLIFVGAPERSFIGRATLASAVHPWAAEEADRYPGDWPDGVSFSSGVVWEHPVAIDAVLPKLALRETNPAAMFQGGVVRISRDDFQLIVGEQETVLTSASSGRRGDAEDMTHDRIFTVVERIRRFASSTTYRPLSEEDTRAFFINPVLEALGYTEFEDVEHGSPSEAGSFPDYVLNAGGSRVIALEAKKFGSPLAAKDAAQLVQYCSVLGVRWGVLTDGRLWRVYDAPVLNVSPQDRLIFEVNLANHRDREDFEVRTYPALGLLSKDEMTTGAALDRRAAQEGVRDLLTTPNSESVRALQSELERTKQIRYGLDELSELVSEVVA